MLALLAYFDTAQRAQKKLSLISVVTGSAQAERKSRNHACLRHGTPCQTSPADFRRRDAEAAAVFPGHFLCSALPDVAHSKGTHQGIERPQYHHLRHPKSPWFRPCLAARLCSNGCRGSSHAVIGVLQFRKNLVLSMPIAYSDDLRSS